MRKVTGLLLCVSLSLAIYSCGSTSSSAPTPTESSTTTTTTTATTTTTTYCGTTPWSGDTTYSVEDGYAVFRLCDVADTSRAHYLGGDNGGALDGFNRDNFSPPNIGNISFKAKGIDSRYFGTDPSFAVIHMKFQATKNQNDPYLSALFWMNQGDGTVVHTVQTSADCGRGWCEEVNRIGRFSWDPNVTYSFSCDWDASSSFNCVVNDESGNVFAQGSSSMWGDVGGINFIGIGNHADPTHPGAEMPGGVKVTELIFKVKK